jgi:hypothetical protein
MADFPHARALADAMSTAVRGPGGLQQDIADEIADHLACHAEAKPAENPTTAESEAIRAFGDPNQIARELRQIHLGDRIMFQRIMVAALVVIVAGMAVTAYLSWSAARETGRQFAEMNRNISSLVEAQRAALPKPLEPAPPAPPAADPVRLRVFCGFAPGDRPAAGYEFEVLTNPGDRRTYKTDDSGYVTTEGLPLDKHVMVMGRVRTPEGTTARGKPEWTRVIKPEKPGETQEVRITVGSMLKHQLRLAIPEELSWNREAMSQAEVVFEEREGSVWGGPTRLDYRSGRYVVDLWKDTEVTGLLPGRKRAYLMLPGVRTVYTSHTRPQVEPAQFRGAWYELGEVDIPAENGPLSMPLHIDPKARIAGLLHTGSREQPLAGTALTLDLQVMSSSDQRGNFAVLRNEPLRTDREGRFVAFSNPIVGLGQDDESLRQSLQGIGPVPATGFLDRIVGNPEGAIAGDMTLPWKTADGEPAILTWPLHKPVDAVKTIDVVDNGRFYEVDLSQLGTVRVKFTGLDQLAAMNREIANPAVVSWRDPRVLHGPPRPPSDWDRSIDLAEETQQDILLFPGTCIVDVSLLLIEREPATPEFERHSVFEWNGRARKPEPALRPLVTTPGAPTVRLDRSAEVKAGELITLEIAVGDPEAWERANFEWHERGGGVAAAPPTGTRANP